MKRMEQLINIKNGVCAFFAVIGGAFIKTLGGTSPALEFLLYAMIVDFVLGMIIGALNKSTKTESGGLNSTIGYKGLAKKVGIIIMVWIGFQADKVIGTEILRNMIIMGYVVNEVLSIVENLSLLGVVKIQAVTKMLDILKQKSESEEK